MSIAEMIQQAQQAERAAAVAEHRRRATQARAERTRKVRELRALEWQFDLHPSRMRALMLRDLRQEISDLEDALIALSS